MLYELELHHRRAVAQPRSELDDACITAGPCGVPWAELLENLVHGVAVVDVAGNAAAVRNATLLAERNHLLGQGPDRLGLGFRRADLLVLEQVSHQAAKQRQTLVRRPIESPANDAVSHR